VVDGGVGGASEGTVAHRGGAGVAVVELLDTLAHPPFLKPFASGAGALATVAEGAGDASLAGVAEGVTPATEGILTPIAAAILRSSFSSRLRSFSFRFSVSFGF
jgi:hypothetical protein